MRKRVRLLSVLLVFYLMSNIIPMQAAAASGGLTGVVQSARANVRNGSGTYTTEIIGTVQSGDVVTIIGKENDVDNDMWYIIEYNGGVGYLFNSHVTIQTKGTVRVDDLLNVRSGPGTGYSRIGRLYNGDTVTVLGLEYDASRVIWYQIDYNGVTGYVHSEYLALERSAGSSDASFEENLRAQGFPDSYLSSLMQLHAQYPNWRFTADHINMDWEYVIANESKVGVNLVSKNSLDSWKSFEEGAFHWATNSWVGMDGPSWVAASESIIRYYMDPRNFLTQSGVFQFLGQRYNASTQTPADLNKIVSGTFLGGSFPEAGYGTYAQAIMAAAAQSNVNPYVIASTILVEQGNQGQGGCISGTVAGYEGYYNYFNIGAYASGSMSAVQRGLWWAKGAGTNETTYQRPWNNRFKSIVGGAQYYYNNYIQHGQDTLYYKKFNVVNSYRGYFKNQYVSNVQAAESEARKLSQAYLSLYDPVLEFNIPVYRNMPSAAQPRPTSTGNNNNWLIAMRADEAAINFERTTTTYSISVPETVTKLTLYATPSDSGATVKGTGAHTLRDGQQTIELVVSAPSGAKRTYTVNVYKQPSSTPVFSSDRYTLGAFLTGVSGATQISEFLQRFQITNGSLQLKDAMGAVKTTGVIATGDQLLVLNNQGAIYAQYQIAVLGDANGDGAVDAKDVVYAARCLAGKETLTDVISAACDVNADDDLNARDVTMLARYLVGKDTL